MLSNIVYEFGEHNRRRISNRAEERGSVLIHGSRSRGSIGGKVRDLLGVLKNLGAIEMLKLARSTDVKIKSRLFWAIKSRIEN